MVKFNKKIAIISSSIFIGTALIVFLILFLTGAFKHPGQLLLDASLTSDEQSLLLSLVENLELKEDLAISAETLTTKLNADETSADRTTNILISVAVPTTDFYGTSSETTFIPIDQLTAGVQLLPLDGEYYLDTFESGAHFRYLTLSGTTEDQEHLQTLLTPHLPDLPTKDTVLSFAQTGVTALSRGMHTKLQQTKDAAFFAANLKDYLSRFDLTHTSNESSFSNHASAGNICSDPDFIDTLTAIGLDIVELTGNHNQDCGDEAARTTIDLYHSLGIQTVGGGKTAAEAAQPLEINQKDTKITLLAYNLSTGGYTLDATPGANFFTLEKATADIAKAKQNGDFVIVDVQYYECNEYVDTRENTTCDYADASAGDQVGFFRSLIDLGADLVVGTSAHQPQTYELYGQGAIYYGLGNLFFDQYWWPGTTRSLILEHYFWQGKHLQTRLTPTVYDHNFQTSLMPDEDATAFLKRLQAARP